MMGEGAGLVVLEERNRALARGARIYAEVVGYGATADAFHMTSPDPTGGPMARAMGQAMKQAHWRQTRLTISTRTARRRPSTTSTRHNRSNRRLATMPIEFRSARQSR